MGPFSFGAYRPLTSSLRSQGASALSEFVACAWLTAVPLSFDETYLPLEIGKKIITNNLKVEPIFSLLERKYDIPLIEAEYKLDAMAAEDEVAKALNVKPRSPIFRIERTSYSTGSRPVDYETLHYRGDLVQFVTRLVRKIPH
jgi:GntR family transcriptional regulator